MKIIEPGPPQRLGFFVTIVKRQVGILPWHGDHGDSVLLLDLPGHIAKLFAANLRSADPLEAFPIVDHCLDRLQSMARLRLDYPHETTPRSIHRGHVRLDIRRSAEQRTRWPGCAGLFAWQGEPPLGQLEE